MLARRHGRSSWRGILSLIAMGVAFSSFASERVEHLSERNFDETVQQLQWLFGGYGLTVVAAVDYQQVLQRMKVTTGRAAMFEVMRRDWARVLLTEDASLGFIIPLRIYVFEDRGGVTKVSYRRPGALLTSHASETLRTLGRELDEKIAAVVIQATYKPPGTER